MSSLSSFRCAVQSILFIGGIAQNLRDDRSLSAYAAFSSRNYRYLLAGVTLSNFGQQMLAIVAGYVVITELAVFRIRDGELHLTELLDDATPTDVAAVTSAPYVVDLEDADGR